MCTVSEIMQYGQERIPDNTWNRQNWAAFHALVEKAQVFDSLTNQPDCADESKLEWAIRIEQRLRDLENKARD